MNIQKLRKAAEEEAKEILKDKTKFGPKEFDAKFNTSKKIVSSLHSLLDLEDINYCLNNGIDIWYLYEEMGSKYNGNVVKEKKQYYIPNGKPRGRPKKYNNEQEQ